MHPHYWFSVWVSEYLECSSERISDEVCRSSSAISKQVNQDLLVASWLRFREHAALLRASWRRAHLLESTLNRVSLYFRQLRALQSSAPYSVSPSLKYQPNYVLLRPIVYSSWPSRASS